MMHPSTMKLVDRLCAMTAQGKINWAHGEAPESLVYDTEGYRVILHGDPTNIQLTDSSGVELENVTAADLAQTSHAESGTYDAVVAKLLIDAQRHARGTETAISTVLQGLDLDGDGIVDMPMEDGLAPTAEEIADPAPDMAEDTADESGVATLADADVTDVSNAVASLADEVNQNETGRLADAAPKGLDVTPEETIQTAPHTEAPNAGTAAGLGMAGLGAAGLLKAARQAPAPSTRPEETPQTLSRPDIERAVPDIEMPQPLQADVNPTTPQAETGFNLSSTDASATPLQLDPLPSHTPADPAAPEAVASAGDKSDTFVPPEPGQVLSLSGLTNGSSKDNPVMAGTATTLSHVNPAAPQVDEPAIMEPPALPEELSPPESPVATAPVSPPTPEPEPTVEAEPEPEPEQVKETPRPSRFNPWI